MFCKYATKDRSIALSTPDDSDLFFEGGRAKDFHIPRGEPRCGRGGKGRDLSLRDIYRYSDGVVPIDENRGR